MADVNPSDIIRTVLKCTMDGRAAVQNVAHWKYTGATGLTATEALADAAAWWDAILDTLESFQSIALTYDSIYAFNETQGTPLGTTDVAGHTNGSENSTVSLPPMVAAGIYALTHVSRVIGKKFFGGFSELNNTTYGEMTSGLITALAAAAAILYDPTLTYNTHDYSGGIWRKATNVLVPVVEAFVNAAWYTQRRRRRGVGA